MSTKPKKPAICDICSKKMDKTTSEHICHDCVRKASDVVMQLLSTKSKQARLIEGKQDKPVHEPEPQYQLDVTYSAFKHYFSTAPKRNVLDDLKRVFSLEEYRAQEQVEMRCGSEWRGNYIYNVRNSAFSGLKARYTCWLEIHNRALSALEGYMIRKKVVSDSVRQDLLDLWAILPLDLFPSGVPKHGQERMIRWLTNAEHDKKQATDRFLDRLVGIICSNDGASKERMQFCKKPKVPKPLFRLMVLKVYPLLVKRLLLQTPLLFWPAILKSGVSYCDIMLANSLPDVCCHSHKQEIVVVTCKNQHIDRDGFETICLWKKGLKGHVINIQRPIRTMEVEIEL
jgi:hypothetical protein